MPVQIKPDHKAIDAYYATLDTLKTRQQVSHEGGLRRAFGELLNATAKVRDWTLVDEMSIPSTRSKQLIRVDGVLCDEWKLRYGYWEAKDEADDLNTEIRRKRERGYPFSNIIFEDTDTAVLFQDGLEVVRVDVRDRVRLADLLTRFYNYTIEPFQNFDEAIAHFGQEIPHIANGLKEKIELAHSNNKDFQTAFDTFMELCRTALNPNIRTAAVDEMLIQHMLTERLIRKVFDAEEFTRRNVIASEVENVIDKLTKYSFNRAEFLGALDRFYTAIEEAADKLADFTGKQRFLNTVYERFFQGYSVRAADTHGIVYTPQEIVDFMCAAVEEVLANEFGKKLGDDDVFVIDPCTGTGSFVANLLHRAHSSNPRHFERFYREQLFANEVMLMPYYIASLNIENAYRELTDKYKPFEGVCFVDTLDLAQKKDQLVLPNFITQENTARVERQKQANITVIVGNPPYNMGQINENDNNKNRKYEIIDKHIQDTYVKASDATLSTKLYDAYVRFFRWATDRLQGRDGIVCFVTNNGFLQGIAFDGFRKHLMSEFNLIYHLDMKGNARTSGERRRQEGGNIFSDQIRVGIGITVLVRNKGNKTNQLFFQEVQDYWKAEQKKAYLEDFNTLSDVNWTKLTPDSKSNWLVAEHSKEYTYLLALASKSARTVKGNVKDVVFKLYSPGVNTARDGVVYDFKYATLRERMSEFCENYSAEVDRFIRRGNVQDIDNFVDYSKIKWSRNLKRSLSNSEYLVFDSNVTRQATYRPFSKRFLYFADIAIDELGKFPQIFPNKDSETQNKVICLPNIGSNKKFACLVVNTIADFHLTGDTQCFPFYVYDEDGGNRRENITDWALAQFRARYGETLNPQPLLPQGEGENDGESGKVPLSEQRQADPSRKVPLPEGEGFRVRVNRVQDDAVFRARASEAMTHIAQDLRQRQTPAEVILWECLRSRRLDKLKFRRQHAIENTAYVVDFLCYEARLVVELDGGVHAGQIEDDAIRQANIEAQGYHVLRIPNEAVYNDLETVLTTIAAHARHTDSPHPTSDSPSSSPGPASDSPSFSPRPEGEGPGVRVITKWDIFYYVYGLLHHPGYRERYADNLKRELPRIPFAPDFWAFSHAGKKLADLHLKYEEVQGYDLTWETKGQQNYRVEKMRLRDPYSSPRPASDSPSFSPRPEGEGSGVRVSGSATHKAYKTLVVNDYLTLTNIPAEAFKYRLGNRSALEWVIDQYQVKTDARSGISSDPNGYSDNPRYIVDLVEKVVRVSVETVQIVDELAALDFRE